MAENPINPIIPGQNYQAEAVAGNSAAIFSATDKEIIEKRSGKVDERNSFLDVLKNKPLMADVENEASTIPPETNIPDIQNRIKFSRRKLKHASFASPRDRLEITNTLPDDYAAAVDERPTSDEPIASAPAPAKPEDKANKMSEKTAEIVRDLNLNPNEVYNKFSLEQDKLHGLVTRIKELHLKRLFSETEAQFQQYTEAIKQETFASTRDEAKDWLESQLNKLTMHAAKYKLKLLESMEHLYTDKQKHARGEWLKEIVDRFTV
ncbi:MAG: hypothetical protein ABIE84_01555 [bacterium]